MKTTLACLSILTLFAAGCGDSNNGGDAGMDLSGAVDMGDMASNADLAGSVCNPTPVSDGTDCHTNFVCPADQVCVHEGGSTFSCRAKCTPGVASTCGCDRSCLELKDADGGVIGAGCLLANAAGERCGNGFNHDTCADQLICAGSQGPDGGVGPSYCNYDCSADSTVCPAQTQCTQIVDNVTQQVIGSACVYVVNTTSGKNLGEACGPTDQCKPGLLCDLGAASPTCQTQCDGPGGTCTSGTCSEVKDTAKNKTIGFVCK
jgi:hypothetical protein